MTLQGLKEMTKQLHLEFPSLTKHADLNVKYAKSCLMCLYILKALCMYVCIFSMGDVLMENELLTLLTSLCTTQTHIFD